MIFETLYESAQRGELLLVDDSMTLAPQFDLTLFPWHHAQRPDLAGVLSLYRTEREQPGTLTIRTGGNGKGA